MDEWTICNDSLISNADQDYCLKIGNGIKEENIAGVLTFYRKTSQIPIHPPIPASIFPGCAYSVICIFAYIKQIREFLLLYEGDSIALKLLGNIMRCLSTPTSTFIPIEEFISFISSSNECVHRHPASLINYILNEMGKENSFSDIFKVNERSFYHTIDFDNESTRIPHNQINYGYTPEIRMIYINREYPGNPGQNKLNNRIDVEDTISICCSYYTCFAFIMHNGTDLNNDEYIAYVRVDYNFWCAFRYNDVIYSYGHLSALIQASGGFKERSAVFVFYVKEFLYKKLIETPHLIYNEASYNDQKIRSDDDDDDDYKDFDDSIFDEDLF